MEQQKHGAVVRDEVHLAVPEKPPRVRNRIAIALMHGRKLSFNSISRLSEATGASRSTVYRLMAGIHEPSYSLAARVTQAIAEDLQLPLTPFDLFSFSGTFPGSGCEAFDCSGCLPEWAFSADGSLKPEFVGQRPGDWSK